jgi:hypothetical protein
MKLNIPAGGMQMLRFTNIRTDASALGFPSPTAPPIMAYASLVASDPAINGRDGCLRGRIRPRSRTPVTSRVSPDPFSFTLARSPVRGRLEDDNKNRMAGGPVDGRFRAGHDTGWNQAAGAARPDHQFRDRG